MTGAVRFDKGVTFTTTTAAALATWQTAITSDTPATQTGMTLPIHNFEKTTDDPEILTSGIGKKRMGKKSYPSGILQLDGSLCDYKHFHDSQNIEFDFVPFFQDGTFWLSQKADGTLKPFRSTMGVVADLPPEDKLNSFPMYLFFSSYQEFERVVVFKPTFQFDDIQDLSPVGLEIRVETAYTSSKVRVVAVVRGTGQGKTGLDQVSDWPIQLVSTGTTLPVAVTVVAEIGQGAYDLTMKKDTGGTPADLAATDTVTIQGQDDDGSNHITYQSGPLDIVGGA
jgi:hypothetical protein